MGCSESYKLAFVVSMYFEFGGMQRSLLRIARACQQLGHKVHLFTGELRGPAPEDIQVTLLNAKAISNTASNDKLAKAFQQAIQGQGFDCVVGFIKIPGLDVYYAGDPCYAARVDENRSKFYKLLPRYHALARQERSVFGSQSKAEILLFAHQERDKYIRYYATEPERIHMLPPGINRQRLLENKLNSEGQQQLRDEFGLSADDHMVLLVGSYFKTKGVDRAIEAIAALPADLRKHTFLLIVGHDDAGPYVSQTASLGISGQVIFTGSRDDVGRFFYTADMLLHPAYTENTGTTLLEAMVCGLPVLATENCGFAFHIEKAGAGMVCPMPFQQEVLNQQLYEMLVSEQRTQWSENGITYAETTDLYGLIDKAAKVIIQRAAVNANTRRAYQ